MECVTRPAVGFRLSHFRPWLRSNGIRARDLDTPQLYCIRSPSGMSYTFASMAIEGVEVVFDDGSVGRLMQGTKYRGTSTRDNRAAA